MTELKPINECRDQNPVTTGFAHSKGKPGASSTTTSVGVRFAPILQVELGIRQLATKTDAKSTIDLRTSLTVARSSARTMEQI